jgi:poly [ADP-ribose] polymerase
VIQLLETDASPKSYYVWNRWGRVGANGQNALDPCGSDLNRALASFNKKYNDKTKNHWANRKNFVSYPGK